MRITGLKIIAERLNYSIPSVQPLMEEAYRSGKFSAIQNIAIKEQRRGADFIDVNLGPLPAEMMADTVRAVQEVSDIPLCIDSDDIGKLRHGLDAYDSIRARGEIPILNSATYDRADIVLGLKEELNKPYGIVLLINEGGRLNGEEAYAAAIVLFSKAKERGFDSSNIYIDPGMNPLIYDT